MTEFYRNIKTLRRQSKINLKTIAEHSGIPARVWSWMEQNGDAAPNYETMRDFIASYLSSRGGGLQTDIEEMLSDQNGAAA